MKTPEVTPSETSWITTITSARVLGHPLVWSAMTAVFILIGYFWLQYYALPYSTQLAEQDKPARSASSKGASNDIGSDVKSRWNPSIYKEIKTEDIMPITQLQDQSRADQYRHIVATEALLQPLLGRASEYMNSENYVLPERANAWEMYAQALEVDPSHGTALSGQQQILQILGENAQTAVANSEYENSERWLAQLDRIQPGNPFQTRLRQKIAAQINEQLAQAEAAQKEVEQLSRLKAAIDDANAAMNATPAKLLAAYDLYSRAMEIEPGNRVAASGLAGIRQIRTDRAKNAISLNNFSVAQQEIDRLKATNADPKKIDQLMAAMRQSQQLKQAQAAQLKAQQLAATQLSKQQPAPKQTTDESGGGGRGQTSTINQPPAPASVSTADAVPSNQPPQSVASLFPEKVEIEDVSVKPRAKPLGDINNTRVVNAPAANNSPATNNNKSGLLGRGIAAYYAGDYNSAFELLHPLAEDGVARAQFRIGIMYYQGRTVVRNSDLATQWIARALPTILRAAQANAAWAQSDLGTAYEMGIGVKKDLTRSARWYERAAQQGYAGAQTNLGVLYGTGEGVKYDRQLAVYWLKRAAQQGDKIAQDNLEILNAR